MKNGKLEKEKEFLLKSLEDLDLELKNGEISSDHHKVLTLKYSKRLARLEAEPDKKESKTGLKRNRKTWLWILFLISVATLAGFAISISSGERTSSDSLTGSIRQSTVTKLSQAQQLFGDQNRWEEAIELYEEVLDQQPSNTEALTYRAWLLYRLGRASNELIPVWNEVLLTQPDFPDAIVFLAIALSDESRYPEALKQLQNLEKIEVSDDLQSVLLAQGLRGEIYAEAKYQDIIGSSSPSLQDLEMTVTSALESANYLLQSEKPQRSVSAIKLFRAILEVDPSNPKALSRESILLAQTGDPVLYERALLQMDTAVQENPLDIEVLITRATLNADINPVLSCGDLEKVNYSLLTGGSPVSPQAESQIEVLAAYLDCDG